MLQMFVKSTGWIQSLLFAVTNAFLDQVSMVQVSSPFPKHFQKAPQALHAAEPHATEAS